MHLIPAQRMHVMEKEVDSIAALLRKVEVSVKTVCHSGKTRAKETAQILSGQIGDGNVYAVFGMSPNNNVTDFAASLKEDGLADEAN